MQKERKDRRAKARTRKAYQLPDTEYNALMRVRDQVRLYAGLLEPAAFDSDRELPMSNLALTQCLRRLAADLDDVIFSAWWPED